VFDERRSTGQLRVVRNHQQPAETPDRRNANDPRDARQLAHEPLQIASARWPRDMQGEMECMSEHFEFLVVGPLVAGGIARASVSEERILGTTIRPRMGR